MDSDSEKAARIILGELDDPEVPIRDLLGDLRTGGWVGLSVGEAICTDLAHQVWSGQTGSVTLAEALRTLDDDNVARLVRAIALIRPRAVAQGVSELVTS